MFSKFKYHIAQGRKVAAIGFGLAGLTLMALTQGLFEPLELGVLDQFFILRSRTSSAVSDRILVIAIDERDIANMGQWPMSDQTLSQLLRNINAHEPASIGVDLYRNFPIAPGTNELADTFESIPNIIGAERVLGEGVSAHETLAVLGRAASKDFVVDDDGKVRRGLMSVISPEGEVRNGLAATLALDYLGKQDIQLELLENDKSGQSLRLGRSVISRFEENDGGYFNADSGGYQVLMNYRGGYSQFESVSMTAALDGELTEAQVRDRIVLIGSTAISLNDLFYTPVDSNKQVAGVYVHAHLLSQLLRAALDGQPFLRTLPAFAEGLWVAGWIAISIVASRSVLYSASLKTSLPMWQLVARFLALGGGLFGTGYGLFLVGWWLPIALPLVSIFSTVGLGIAYRNQQLQNLAAYDELTQIANRRYFDQYLDQLLKTNKQLSLILCDVDFFKAFNDLYGHPAGDRCLYQVAQALKIAVRDADLVARYGGEEFVVVLPDTDEAIAALVSKRIQSQIRGLKIAHEGSKVDAQVTLSGGFISLPKGSTVSPRVLVDCADKALYKAKLSGRNQILLGTWSTDEDEGTIDFEAVA